MNADQIPTLPALRTLGNLADVRPTIITDTREQTPLLFTNLVTVLGTLTSGDYAPRGLEHIAAIERKSAADAARGVELRRNGSAGGGRRVAGRSHTLPRYRKLRVDADFVVSFYLERLDVQLTPVIHLITSLSVL